ncbi:MAG: MFS transporter [Chthoniobacterales bacterium]
MNPFSFIPRLKAWWARKNEEASGVLKNHYVCGTLRYTPATLFVLFAWLLWGDFTFTLMESMPSLLNMQLKDHNISNQTIALLTTTLISLTNIALNPVISSFSDRYRSRWGRRRPFLMFATPVVSVCLILIPWTPNITVALQKIPFLQAFFHMLPFSPLVLMFGVFILSFQLSNMFIATVYYYLIPDTVPEPFIGRFYGLFRVFGIFAGMIFNWFVFGAAHQHMRMIFTFFSALYGISFLLMCWKVREGEYAEVKEEHGHWFSPIKNYVVQCFGTGRNWMIFLVYGAIQWAGAVGVFNLFFYRDEIGLTETDIGRLATFALSANLLLSVPFGALVDRLNSQKALMIGLITGSALFLICFFFIHSRTTALVLGFMLNIPAFLTFLALTKWTVDMYPRTQYGQYGSAGAIFGAIGAAILSPIAGKIIDHFGNYYRLCLLVPAICYALGFVFSIILFYWPRPTDDAAGPTGLPEEEAA